MVDYRNAFDHPHLVWHRLKEYGGCWNLLLVSHEAMCEVTSIWKVKSHDSAMRLYQCCVYSKVSRRPCITKNSGKNISHTPRLSMTSCCFRHSKSDVVTYLSMAERWPPIYQSEGHRLPKPSSDTTTPARQHVQCLHNTCQMFTWIDQYCTIVTQTRPSSYKRTAKPCGYRNKVFNKLTE